jgi:outer membrane receptor protein involved in Fe transport
MNPRNMRSAAGLAALPMGIAMALAGGAAVAQDAATPATPAPEAQAATLDRIEVTGSRIRRVDAENASPVVSISRAQIEKTGKLTLGDLLQELPNMAGAPTNPQVNNGGGTGASSVDLRGFGAARTLTLVDGRRVINPADINAIPASAVERIEVLTVGASSVYGSDAIAGVVNFIMRKDFEGMEATVNYGLSSRSDGERTGGSLTFGQQGDKGNIIAGVDYNRFKSISSADRDYSKDATYLYYGSVFVSGSSRTPFGRISLPEGNAFGCDSVTRIPGTSGTSQADYRCYDGQTDAFNYQRTNLILTPQERTNAFFLANYQITDDVSAYLQTYHNKTSSSFAIAALPFDANSDKVTISADSYYNPFGVDFGPASPDGLNFLSRFTSLGQRSTSFATTQDQVFAGLNGFLGETWKWDAGFNYGHITANSTVNGYVFYQGLRDALGPSFLDPATGVVTCGTAAAPIANCTPLNIFNIEDPQTIATLSKYNVAPLNQSTQISKGFDVNASGELFNLPAGAVQLAFGGDWHREYLSSKVDYVTIANPDGSCFISQEACGSPVQGSYSVGELYAELFVPVLKDMPFAKALNVTFGSRYSNYSNFGNTVNNKLQVEWRPIDDLLLRGTVADVFRAPTVTDLFAGPGGNAPTASDPCVGYTNDPAHAAACGAPTGATNIPTGGIAPQPNSQLSGVVSGSIYAGYDLQPEHGRSFDWGLVYDPSWLPGASISLDYWRLVLLDTIQSVATTGVPAQTVLNACYNDSNSPFCSFIHRTVSGQVDYIEQPAVNLGRLDAKGWDLALRYRLPETRFGTFNFGFDGTYLAQWDNDTDTTSELDPIIHVAGHYNNSYGNYSRVRGRLFADWNRGDWSLGWRTRYVGGFRLGSNDVRQLDSADGACGSDPQYCYGIDYGSYLLHSVQAGFALPSSNARIEVGVDNLTDKQPPMMFNNNVLNANTDVNTFDTIGRYFWARYSIKF